MKELEYALNKINGILTNSEVINTLSELVEINTAIVGGAVRDTLLGKNVKDIDIYVQVNYYKNLKIDYTGIKDNPALGDDIFEEQLREAAALEQRSAQITRLLSSNELLSGIISELNEKQIVMSNQTQMIIRIIEYVLKNANEHTIEKVYTEGEVGQTITNNKNIKEIAYAHNGLNAVINIKDKEIDLPIDLLFTTDRLQDFLDRFDFNICKVALRQKSGTYETLITPEFSQDKENQTITYKPVSSINEIAVKRSLDNRFIRLSSKYSDYDLKLDDTDIKSSSIYQYVKSYTNLLMINQKLSRLPKKEKTNKMSKI